MSGALQVGVIGAGSFGTALAQVSALGGHRTILLGRDPVQVDAMVQSRHNPRYLKDLELNLLVQPTADPERLRDQALWILAVPSQSMRGVCRSLRQVFSPGIRIVHVAKGLEIGTQKRLSQVILEELPIASDAVAVLSGPSHAEEIARRLPTTVAVASASQSCAEFVQDVLMHDRLRLYTTPDVVGAEIGGALKNVIALGCGIADGLHFGDNARAALITRGLVEIARLGVRMGAAYSTFSGLTGVGDLVVTCNSRQSRNWSAGYLIGQGRTPSEAVNEIGMAVEGVSTARTARALCDDYKVEMPIALAISDVLFSGKSPLVAVEELMTRSRTHEVEELAQESTVDWVFA